MTDLDLILSDEELVALQAGARLRIRPYIQSLPTPLPHFQHIRVCQLDYFGVTLGAFERQLLSTSVDLVVAGETSNLTALKAVSPATPAVVYTNCSNIYGDLLSDWLAHAAAQHLDPEIAFLHDSGGARVLYNHISSRPLTNPSSPAFCAWAIDYHRRFLAANKCDGLFMDNSPGNPSVMSPGMTIKEDVSGYRDAYAALLASIAGGLGCRVIPNIGGGSISNVTPIVRGVGSFYAEFALHPLGHNWRNFEDVAYFFAALPSTGIIDTHPVGGSPSDSRTQLAALAYFYLIAQPGDYIDFFGGFAPGTPWAQHWCPATTFDVGKPSSDWSITQIGQDPSDSSAIYKVYARYYTNAHIYLRPLSFRNWQTKADIGDRSAAAIQLPKPGRVLGADGTLGPSVSSITLRNGEGAIVASA